MSSVALPIERFLERAGFDLGPWAVVAFSAGVGSWFILKGVATWLAFIAFFVILAVMAGHFLAKEGRFSYLRRALTVLGFALALGCCWVWVKSSIVGTRPIAHEFTADFHARILEREDRPADNQIRLVLTLINPETGKPIRVRVSMSDADDTSRLIEGTEVSLKARVMPPASPLLPGSYDYARVAWFKGLSGTGRVIGDITIVRPQNQRTIFNRWREDLSQHIQAQLPSQSGALANAFVTGERGGISKANEVALRDSGLPIYYLSAGFM